LFERGRTGRRWTTPDSSSWPITRFGKAIAFVVNNNIHTQEKRRIASLCASTYKKKDLLGINEFLLIKCVMISWIYCVLLSSIPSTLQSSRRWAESVFCCCLLEWNDNRPASLIAPLSRPSPFADLHETHAANKSLDDNIRRANLEFFCCWSKMSMSSPRFTGLIIIISYSSFLKKLIVYNSRFLIFVTEAGKNGFTHSSIEF
jgi:hypothetical protein